MNDEGSGQATPRFKVLAALAAHGKLAAVDIKSKTDGLDDRQVGNALYSAKGADHVSRDDKGQWQITKKGRSWLTGGAKFTPPRAAKTSPANVKTSRRQPARKGKDLDAKEKLRAGVVDITPRGEPRATAPQSTGIAPARSRFAIFNDGHFYITKNGVEIDLDPQEHKDLLTYLDRLAEPLARAP